MEIPRDLDGMQKAAKSNINFKKRDSMPKVEQLSFTAKFNMVEEYKTLRKPKPSTLLKIQKSKQIKSVEMKTQSPSLLSNGPLRKESSIIENIKTDIPNKYVFRKQPESRLKEDYDSDEIDSEDFDLNGNTKKTLILPDNLKNTKLLSKNISLNYNEYHLVNILHTKIMAHSNGFFANNIPNWYKTTFDKVLPLNWLEILEKSSKFSLENINNKIVIYALDDISKTKSDAYSPENMAFDSKYNEQVKELKNTANRTDSFEDSSGTFVRYQHLENAMKQYTSKNNAGRDIPYTSNEKSIKTSDKLNNPNSSKSNVRYKHLQGHWSK